ncbi:hypothetical protein C8R43DRAFT_1053439 [Mycena crocata]|nr:hypothetical protein C8R43DRAFT_1053439 [Mycena crocata]
MPPKIDLSALPPLDQIKGASIGSLNRLSSSPLPKDITVKDLKPQVLEALKLPKFATDPRFLKFSIYRPATTGAAPVKNSADKSAQDAQAAAQHSNAAPTGQTRPKFKVLSNGEHKEGAAGLRDIKDDESSLSSSQSEVVKPSSQAPLPPPAGKVENQAPEFAIIVEFTGGGSSESREVYILPPLRQGIPVAKGPGDGYLSSLKKLIPAALANFSSLNGTCSSAPENSYSCVWYPDFNDMKLTVTGLTGGLLSLGTAGEFSKGNIPPVLELREGGYLKKAEVQPIASLPVSEAVFSRIKMVTSFPAFAEHTNTGYHRYASRRFNKAEIEDALGISKGVASGDRGLFEHRDLPFVDDAQKWVDGNLVRDEDRAIRSAFDKMAPKEWKHYLETSKKRGDKEREKEARRNKDEKRKRRAESEAEANKDAKTRKRQRRHKSVDTAAGSEEDEEIILQAKLREIKRKKQRAAAAAMLSNESDSDDAQAGPSRSGGRSRISSSHLDSESDPAHT